MVAQRRVGPLEVVDPQHGHPGLGVAAQHVGQRLQQGAGRDRLALLLLRFQPLVLDLLELRQLGLARTDDGELYAAEVSSGELPCGGPNQPFKALVEGDLELL